LDRKARRQRTGKRGAPGTGRGKHGLTSIKKRQQGGKKANIAWGSPHAHLTNETGGWGPRVKGGAERQGREKKRSRR